MIINGMEKKLIQNREQLFIQATPTSNELQQYSSGGIAIPDRPATSRSRRPLLLSVVGNIWLLVSRDTAI